MSQAYPGQAELGTHPLPPARRRQLSGLQLGGCNGLVRDCRRGQSPKPRAGSRRLDALSGVNLDLPVDLGAG